MDTYVKELPFKLVLLSPCISIYIYKGHANIWATGAIGRRSLTFFLYFERPKFNVHHRHHALSTYIHHSIKSIVDIDTSEVST
ncbi:unnamed protein product [Rotaria socialis]